MTAHCDSIRRYGDLKARNNLGYDTLSGGVWQFQNCVYRNILGLCVAVSEPI
jgi:hypothetical protein